MRPIFDNVLLKDLQEESKVIVVESKQQIVRKGEVIATGPGQIGIGSSWMFVPPQVKKGDIVYYLKATGVKIIKDKEEFIICKERDILIIENT